MTEFYKVEGNYYQVGYNIGKRFKEEINRFYKNYDWLHSVYIPFYNTTIGYQIYNNYLNFSNKFYPNYIQELQGYSDSTEIPFYYLFLAGLRVEITNYIRLNPEHANDCTDIFSFQHNILGHNEDMHNAIANTAYIVNVNITKENNLNIEKFVAYCYPGHLPGNAMGFNCANDKNPLIITMNGLSCNRVELDAIPRAFLCRDVIGNAQSVAHVKSILNNTSMGSAVGFSVNVLDSGSYYNIEVAPASLNPNVNIANHINDNCEDTKWKGYHIYPHFNKYEHYPGVFEIPEFIVSSEHRETRTKCYVQSLKRPIVPTDILELLSDTTDTDYPIYRTCDDTNCVGKSVTLATGIFDLSKSEWRIYKGKCCMTKPIIVIDLKSGLVKSFRNDTNHILDNL